MIKRINKPRYFFQLSGCRNGFMCLNCRTQSERGREWRLAKVEKYDDIIEVDFDCPRGRPWIYPTEKEPIPEGHKPDPRIDICRKCMEQSCIHVVDCPTCGGGSVYQIMIRTSNGCAKDLWPETET